MSARAALLFAFALFSAAMLGLAAGAIWMVATLYLGRALPWLALPIGIVLGWAIRHGVRRPGLAAALLAALATALATVYVSMLMVAVEIAGSMGMGLVDAMRAAGPGMLWQLAHTSLGRVDLAWTALAMPVAAWLAWRTPRARAIR